MRHLIGRPHFGSLVMVWLVLFLLAGPLAVWGSPPRYPTLPFDPRPRDHVPVAPQTTSKLDNLPTAATSQFVATLDASRYAVRKPHGETNATITHLWAHNPAMGFGATFSPDKVDVMNTRSGVGAWTFSMKLVSYGYSDTLQSVSPGRIQGDANRLTLTRDSVVEWYVNTPAGMEHGFTLAAPPGRQGHRPLVFCIAVGGNLQPRLRTDATQIELVAPDGHVALTYSKLKVIDARGKVLPANMTVVSGDDQTPQPTIRIAVNDTFAVYPLVVDPLLQTPKLTAGDGEAGDGFGISVAMSGDILAVGARGDNTGRGAIYIFERHYGGTDNWGQAAKLTASDASGGDDLGWDVAVSGHTVVSGAAMDDVVGLASGSAYVFDRAPGGTWSQTKKLTPSDGATNDFFGRSVGISGDVIVIGADSNDHPGGDNEGAAYIYSRNLGGADNWGTVKKLTASDGAAGDFFGRCTRISGDTIAIGANWDDDNGGNSGSVYIFDRDVGGIDNWGQSAKLIASDGGAGEDFGYRLAIDGDTVIVGARYHSGISHFAGAAYVFERDQTDTWSETAKLTAADSAESDYFGHAVAINGDTLIVGADGDDDHGAKSGSAYIFDKDRLGSGNWNQTGKLTTADGAADDIFGRGVALSGLMVTVGAPGDDDLGSFSGSAYLLDRTPAITVTAAGSLITNETGGTGTLTVVLDTDPGVNVTIPVACSDTSECTVSPTSLVFTTSDWNSARTVTVTGVNDDVADGDQSVSVILARAQSTGIYNDLDPNDVAVINRDDDMADVLISPTSGLSTTESGGIAQFTVSLTSEPLADVSFTLASDDATEGMAAPGSLTFTSGDWDQPQTVTVTGVDDAIADGNQSYTVITDTATSSDTAYNTLNPDDVALINTDDDVVGVTVTPTTGLTTNENGATAQFSMVLNTQPLDDVRINLGSDDSSEATVSPVSLVFTPSDWDTVKTVTITGVHDDEVDGDQSVVISTHACISSDLAYSGVDPPNVSAVNQDTTSTGSPPPGSGDGSTGGGGCFISIIGE